ncbi:MAG: beta-hexosaminidase [Gammaproteobacteria bacterium SG8_31]|jgi:beta-N-acetylhexosaminidase|nr:MAG: beta-hexosaminidase [Gammaproteobacteria bacterium SG8_31]
MTLGPLMLDLEGTELSAEERDILEHPVVGGVILFSRNFHSPEQLAQLTSEIHAIRRPPLLVAVDQEGGRVQRFREGFTPLPAVHLVGRQYDLDVAGALSAAETLGWIMAAELRAVGVDLSFAPVLDLDWGISEVIGDRAFHRLPRVVSALARRYIRGMAAAGMTATGKHFPGHGAVAADSHRALPEDRRSYADIAEDIVPFEFLIPEGLGAVMAAHVRYSEVDPAPASFSRWWLTTELRGRMGFRGVIFSDDLVMAAAEVVGGVEERARAALEAGCDMILVCNDREASLAVIDALGDYSEPAGQVRLARMHGRKGPDRNHLLNSQTWADATDRVRHLTDPPPLELNG